MIKALNEEQSGFEPFYCIYNGGECTTIQNAVEEFEESQRKGALSYN